MFVHIFFTHMSGSQ